MSETPDTPEGALTEKIMANIRERVPELGRHVYNPIFTAVYETLQKEFPAIRAGLTPMTKAEMQQWFRMVNFRR